MTFESNRTHSMKDMLRYVIEDPIWNLITIVVIALSEGLLATPYYIHTFLPGLAILAFMPLGLRAKFGFYIIVSLASCNVFQRTFTMSGYYCYG